MKAKIYVSEYLKDIHGKDDANERVVLLLTALLREMEEMRKKRSISKMSAFCGLIGEFNTKWKAICGSVEGKKWSLDVNAFVTTLEGVYPAMAEPYQEYCATFNKLVS